MRTQLLAKGNAVISFSLAYGFVFAYFLQINPQPPTLNGIILMPLIGWAVVVAVLGAASGGLERIGEYRVEILLLCLTAGSFTLSILVNLSNIDIVEVRPYLFGMAAFASLWILASHPRVMDLSFELYAFVAGLICLLQVFGGMTFYPTLLYGVAPTSVYASGFSAFANYGAIFLTFSIAVTIFAWVRSEQLLAASAWWRAIVVLVGSAGLAVTLSRASYLGLFVVLVLLIVKCWTTRYRLPAMALSGLVVMTMAVTLSVVPAQHSAYAAQKLSVVGSSADASQSFGDLEKTGVTLPWWAQFGSPSVNSRVFSLHSVFNSWGGEKFFGVGVGNFEKFYEGHYSEVEPFLRQYLDHRAGLSSHNAYLGFMIEAGPIALLGAILLMAVIFIRGIQQPLSGFGAGYAAGLAAVAVWMVFHDGFEERVIWIAMGLTLALSGLKNALASKGGKFLNLV